MTWNPRFLAMGSTDGCLRNHIKEPLWKVVISCLLHLAGTNETYPKEQTRCGIVETYMTADGLGEAIPFGKCRSPAHHLTQPPFFLFACWNPNATWAGLIAFLSSGLLVCEMGMKISSHNCNKFVLLQLGWVHSAT